HGAASPRPGAADGERAGAGQRPVGDGQRGRGGVAVVEVRDAAVNQRGAGHGITARQGGGATAEADGAGPADLRGGAQRLHAAAETGRAPGRGAETPAAAAAAVEAECAADGLRRAGGVDDGPNGGQASSGG